MAILDLEQRAFDFRPAAYGSNETRNLIPLPAGFRVISAAARVTTAWNGTPTIAVGVTGTANRYMVTGDFTLGTPGLYQGSGAGLANGGDLIKANTFLTLTYTGAASGNTAGAVRVTVTGYREVLQ